MSMLGIEKMPTTTANPANIEEPAALGATRSAAQQSPTLTAPPERPFAKSAPTRRGKIRKKEIANFTAQLAIMTRSGVDLATALESLVRQCHHPALVAVLEDVHALVVGGKPFSQAIREHEAVFGPTYVATIAAGEASGEMSNVLRQLSHLQRSELRMSRTLRSLIAYPVLLASVSSVVILALVLFVLPQFADIFEQYDTPLPVLTRILLGLATELRSHWWLWGSLGVLLVAGLMSLRFSQVGRHQWDRFLVHCVIIRDVTRILLVGRICRLLGLMIESGVPLVESLRLVRSATGNSLYAQLFAELEHEVVNGRGMATALQQAKIVPHSASEMICTAERTGNLGEVTRLIGEHFEEEGEVKMQEIVGTLEPLITVGMGVIVAVVVMSVMLPMFDLATFADHAK